MIAIEQTEYLNDFENKISNIPNKEKLLDILKSRLEGNFKIDIMNNDDNKSFDFTYKLSDEQKYYLEEFDKYYYSIPLVSESTEKYIGSILNEIKSSYEDTLLFFNKKPESIKESLLTISLKSNKEFKLNNYLQIILIYSKLNTLNKLIKKHFNYVLEKNFHVNQFIKISENNYFKKFYIDVLRYIRNKCMNIYRSDNINEEKKNNVTKIVESSGKILNGLFWITYANEFKLIDEVQEKYFIKNELLEEYEKKLSEWFTITDTIETENGEIHTNKINLLESFIETYDEKDNEIYTILEAKMDELNPNLDDNIISKILEDELDNYVNKLSNDNDEKKLYKELFGLNISMCKLFNTMDKVISNIF